MATRGGLSTLLDSVRQDVRYGARALLHAPAFAAIAVLSMAVAIAVNVGAFTVVETLVWRPLPVPDARRLVDVRWVDAGGARQHLFSYGDYVALRGGSRSLEGLLAFTWREMAVARPGGGGSDPEFAAGSLVSGNYFDVLRARPALGRLLEPADESPTADPVAVLDHRFWERRFGGSRAVLGSTLLVDGVLVTVVGVAPRSFVGVESRAPDLWVPLGAEARFTGGGRRLADDGDRWLQLRGRLAPGRTRDAAQAELAVISQRRATATRDAEGGRADALAGVAVLPGSALVPLGPEELALVLPALLAVLLVLGIACANLANLLLARAVVRQREIGVRLAIGAARGRVVRQLLTEGLLISGLAAALGLLASDWALGAVARATFAALPREAGVVLLDLHPDARVAAYTVALAAGSALAFGLFPALTATARDLSVALRGGDRALGDRVRRSTLRNGLVAVQVAGSLVLLVGAAVLAGSARALATADPGVRTEGVAVARFGRRAGVSSDSALAAARDRFALGTAVAPGVDAAALVLGAPLSGPLPRVAVRAGGAAGAQRLLRHAVVAPEFFGTIGLRVREGRAFSRDEASGAARVVVVSASAARRLWGARTALGEQLWLSRGGRGPEPYDVVGVSEDARLGWLWERDEATVYLPLGPADARSADLALLVRSALPARALEERLRTAARAADPGVPLSVTPLGDLLDLQVLPFSHGAAFATIVGLIAVALAAVGLYGVVSFAVAQRTREIGIRLALGAQTSDVVRLALGREMRLVLAGAAGGAVLALIETRLLASWVLPLAPLGAAGFAAVVALVVAIGAAAVLVPARRALRVDPAVALRQD